MEFGSACPRERRVFRSPRVETAAGMLRQKCRARLAETSGVRSKGMCGRAACPWASSNARSIENRAGGIPAKDLRLPSASSPTFGSATTSSGSRQRKARGRGDLRLETRVTQLLPGVSSDTRGRARPHDGANRRAGDRSRRASRVMSFVLTMNGGEGRLERCGVHRAVHPKVCESEPQGSRSKTDGDFDEVRWVPTGFPSFADWVAKHLAERRAGHTA